MGMAAAEIRALVVTENGDHGVLEVQSRPMPEPAADEVVIDVAAAGVNFRDVYERIGAYPVPTPFVLGSEAAGRVLAVGSAVSDFAVGDHVATASAVGAMAGAVAAKAAFVVSVPAGVDLQIARAAMLQ